MINYLKGTLLHAQDTTLTLNVNGVGYEVHAGQNLVTQVSNNQDLELHIHTHVTESSLQLFGFKSMREKTFFKKLLSVSGIGPKMAITIVGSFDIQSVMSWIIMGQVKELTSLPGVGKKTAERIVLDLKDKLGDDTITPESFANSVKSAANTDSRIADTTQALVSLGYSENIARKVIGGINLSEHDTVQTLIKKSLGIIQK